MASLAPQLSGQRLVRPFIAAAVLCFLSTATAFRASSPLYRISSSNSNSPLLAVAPFKERRKQNVPGNLFVDESCIDCDICRWMCPSTFARKGLGSVVTTQPKTDEQKIQAYAAMITCPVGAIRLENGDSLVKTALEAFPAAIDPVNLPNVFHLGYSSSESLGATSYLIKRPKSKGGNVMIDCPRFNSNLASNIEAEGGVDTIIFTHKDDIPHHDKWKTRFPDVQRIIHKTDATSKAREMEIKLEGTGAWKPSDDYQIIHTPGHTAGSLCVLFKTPKDSVLFSGDTLGYSASRKALEGFKRYNQGNEEVQEESIRMLGSEAYTFQWILPAHGRLVRFGSVDDKNKAVVAAADSFREEDGSEGILGIGYY